MYGIGSFNDYLILSDRLKTEKEKFIFAYAVMIRFVRLGKYNVRQSDTPRNVKTKLRGSDIENDCRLDISGTTDDHEHIEYAGIPVDEKELKKQRSDIEAVIKRLIFSLDRE